MAKPKINYFVVAAVAVAVIAFSGMGPSVNPAVTENGVELKVLAYRDGVFVGELGSGASPTMSVLQYDPDSGGQSYSEITEIAIQHTISQLPTADVDVDINNIAGSYTTKTGSQGDSRYDTALNVVSRMFTLLLGTPVTETSGTFDITALEGNCDTSPYCTFKLQLSASYDDIDPDTGQRVSTTIPADQSYGTIVLKISGEQCSDGTPFGQCSASIIGQYCDGTNGLVDCAAPTGCLAHPSGCACPGGWVDVSAICTEQLCLGGSKPGQCTGTLANMCNPSCTTANCNMVQDCYNCGQAGQDIGTPLGWLDSISNAAECPFAYDGVTPASSCHEVQKTCKYQARKPDLTVVLQ